MNARQGQGIEALCVDMWEPFRLSIEERAPGCKIIHHKFPELGHANEAVDEVRKAEFFRQGPEKRELIKGKKWLLLTKPLAESEWDRTFSDHSDTGSGRVGFARRKPQ